MIVKIRSALLCTSELMEFMEISVSQGASQGASQGRSFLARAFDLARPGVAPPLCFQLMYVRLA